MSVLTGIDPLRLAEIDEANGSMLSALQAEHASQRSTTDELLRMLIQQVDRLIRQTVVLHHGTPPDPIEVRLPSDPVPEKPALRSVVGRMLKGG